LNLQEIIYKKLLEVPSGKVTTYGDLAKAAGIKNGQRVIGQFMNKNPFPLLIPCHRVVRSNGEVGGYAYGEKVKTNLLEKEGLSICDGKILEFKKMVYEF
jgi:methylated-DNA-[protein]-cysteine S-methyltransferase